MSVISGLLEGIARAITSEFTDKDIEVYTEEIKQGFIAPAFLVQCIYQNQSKLLDGGDLYDRSHPCCIQFFPESETAYKAECADVAERLETALRLVTPTGDSRPVHGTDMHYEVENGVMSFFVTFAFHVRIVNSDSTEGEIMETMDDATTVQEG